MPHLLSRPVTFRIATFTFLSLVAISGFAGPGAKDGWLHCPADQSISIGTEAWLDSLTVHNSDETPIIVSYILTDSQSWVCNSGFYCSRIMGLRKIDPGGTILLGPCLQDVGVPVFIPESVAAETVSQAVLQVRHQDPGLGPELTITLLGVGSWEFCGIQEWNDWPEVQVDSGQALEFQWDSAGEDSRSGVDIADLYDLQEPGWRSEFIPQVLPFQVTYYEGTHGFVVQTMQDDAMATMGGVVIRVIQIPGSGEAGSVGGTEAPKDRVLSPDSEPWYSECEFLIRATSSVGSSLTSWGALKALYR